MGRNGVCSGRCVARGVVPGQTLGQTDVAKRISVPRPPSLACQRGGFAEARGASIFGDSAQQPWFASGCVSRDFLERGRSCNYTPPAP